MPKRKPTKPRASSPPQSPSSPTFANKDKPIRDQYHHSIPRFILRRYQVGPVLPKPERMKAYRRTGVDPEYVLFYDIENQSLDTRPIGKVYGTKNLYRDAKNSFNVNHLEEKLAQLEKQAATVIKAIHDAIPRHKFTLTRPELDCLRKFLFLMHYRRQTMWVSLFDKDLPGNEDGRDRLEAYGKAKGLKTPADIWLHFLQYFLETPHEQINKEGTKWLKKHKAWDELSDPEKVGTPGAMENFEAMLYQQQAQGFFPGIWEAADGEEFVLTPSSFGMQEGYHYQVREMYMHRIYIISPRLAIVLRNSFLRPEHGGAKFRTNCASVLADYPLEFSEPTYASGRNGIPWDRNASPGELAEALANYRLSEQAQKDTFTFKIFKLTSDQTLDLNKAVLHCTAPTGSVTFTSKSFMVRSLNYYMRRVPLWQDPKKRPRYEALLEQLLRPPKEPEPPSVEVDALNERAFTFVMSLLLRSTRTPSSVSVYNCASTFIQQLPFLVAIGGDTDFVRDHRRGISAVLAHLYHIPKSKREAAGDYVIRPASFATIATNILLEAGRPLLQVAAPSLICSARSSDLDRLLEATVIVRILDASVENRRLRTALRSECPALAAFLIKVAKPPEPRIPPKPSAPPKAKATPKTKAPPPWPSHPRVPPDLSVPSNPAIAHMTFNMLMGQAMAGRLGHYSSRYELGRTVQPFCAVCLGAPPGVIKSLNPAIVEYGRVLSVIIQNAGTQLYEMSPSYRPRTNVRLKHPSKFSPKDADKLMDGALLSMRILNYNPTIEESDDPQTALLNKMIRTAIVYGYLDWLLTNRQDMLDLLVQDMFEEGGQARRDISFVLEDDI